jgi:hypothetical protein
MFGQNPQTQVYHNVQLILPIILRMFAHQTRRVSQTVYELYTRTPATVQELEALEIEKTGTREVQQHCMYELR